MFNLSVLPVTVVLTVFWNKIGEVTLLMCRLNKWLCVIQSSRLDLKLWALGLYSWRRDTHPTLNSEQDGGGFHICWWHSIQSHQTVMAGKRVSTSSQTNRLFKLDGFSNCSRRRATVLSSIKLNICRDTMRALTCTADLYPGSRFVSIKREKRINFIALDITSEQTRL